MLAGFLIALGALVALVVLVTLAGYLLPREHIAASRIVLHQPAEAVWARIRDLGGVHGFWGGVRSVRRLPDSEGRERWQNTLKNGFVMKLEVVADEPPTRLVTRILSAPSAPFGGEWTYQVAELADGGTSVAVTEDGWIANPLFRIVSTIVGYHGTMDAYLKSLSVSFGESATPAHQPPPARDPA